MTEQDRRLVWTETAAGEERDYGIFRTCISEMKAPDGREGNFVRIKVPDWIYIVAVVRDDSGRDCFLMVRQYRHGTGRITTEFPAGTVEPGEDPMETAFRELKEETGYEAEKMTLIGSVNTHCAMMNNTCHTFFAEGLRKTSGQDLDYDETIDVVLVPVEEAEKGFGSGELTEAMCISAHYWYIKMKKIGAEYGQEK